MTPRKSQPESASDKGGESCTPPTETPMERFRSLTKRLLNVSRDEMRGEQERHNQDRQSTGRAPRKSDKMT